MEKTELITMNKEEIVSSVLIPEEFKKSPKDVIIAVDFAKKQGKTIGTTLVAFDYALKFKQSPLTILQAMYEVDGKIGWSADFLLSLLKTIYKKIDFIWDEKLQNNPAVKMVAEDSNGKIFETEFCFYKNWVKQNDNWLRIPKTMLKRRAITLFARTNNPELFANCYDDTEVGESKEMKNITEPIEVKPEIKPTIIEATVENVENNNNKKNRF